MSLLDYLKQSLAFLISRIATLEEGEKSIVLSFDAVVIRFDLLGGYAEVVSGVDHLDLCNLLESLVCLYSLKYPENEN